ncbi:hypothetical protein PPACK8108_LOCUS511 [Phakopsora pachyrhizi]|uniref:Uncharacterized protein n=1 Tax=Phakopsora pachyrhizi TaxID=170000 RepID=A0AAV0AHH1_PHAPC|nr:hypothetical protein PPACK8108_LOCUS511 [Phakopsora pachyrhizi]
MDRFKVCGYQVEIDRKKRLGEDEMGAEDNEERGCNLEGHRWNGKDVNVLRGGEEDDKREKDWPGEREEDEVEGVIQLEELCGIGIGKFGQLPKTLRRFLCSTSPSDPQMLGVPRVVEEDRWMRSRPAESQDYLITTCVRSDLEQEGIDEQRGMGEQTEDIITGLIYEGKSQMKQPENDNTDKVKMNKDGKTQARDGGIDVGELTRDSRSITSDRMKLKLRLEWTETVAN